jgi:hypothetical protein
MTAVILSTTPEPVRWHYKLTVSSEELGRPVNVTFYADDEGVDLDTADTDNGYVPIDVLHLLAQYKVRPWSGELWNPAD